MPEISAQAKVFRVALSTLLLITGVPALTFLTGFSKAHPVAALVLILVWEAILLLVVIASRVFKKLADLWVDRITKLVDNKLVRISSRYTSSYKKHIRAANSHMEQLGLATRSEYALGLRDIYISLSLDPNSIHTLSSNPLDYNAEALAATCSTIWEWIAESRKYENILAIIGPPGSGKTTILKHVALIMVDNHGRKLKKRGIRRGTIPVILTLRDLKSHFQDDNALPKIPDLIRQGLADLSRSEPPLWVENNLQRNRFLIMFDGLDEVASGGTRRRISKWIDRQQELYPEATFIVTSRPFGYQATPLCAATVVQVRPFSEGEVKKFVTRWYRATAGRRYGDMHDSAQLYAAKGTVALTSNISWSADVLELAVNPLLLTMVCNVHEYRGALPGTRLELYKEICDVLLSRRNQDRGIESPVSGIKKQAVLQRLALHMMEEGIRDIASRDLETVVGEAVARVTADCSALELIKEIEESSGLIVERETSTYGFAHLSFQEYLASVEIVESQLSSQIYMNLDSSWWRETILLYAAQSDATEIVERCLARQNDISLLSLAVTCSEVSREMSPSVRQALSRLGHGDFRNDKDRRRTAGAVQVFSRLPSFTRVAEDTYVSRRPVTWLEYQLFVDQAAPQYVPDDWREAVFRSGEQDGPAVGIRASDAASFCMWLQGVYGDGWSYRPIGSEIARSLCDSSFLEPGTVDVTYAMKPRLAEPSTVELHHGELIEEGVQPALLWDVVSVPLSAAGMPAKIHSILAREMALDRELVLSRSSQGAIDKSGLDDARLLNTELAPYLIDEQADDKDLLLRLKNISRSEMWLDLASCLHWSEAASASVRELLTLSGLDSAQEEIWRLSALSEMSARGLAIAFNRITPPESRFTNCHEERITARLASIAAYRICDRLTETLEQSRIESPSSRASWLTLWKTLNSRQGTVTSSAHSQVIERKIAGSGSSMLSPEYLRSRFLSIYYNLLLLESRIHGRSIAWEGLLVSRTRR